MDPDLESVERQLDHCFRDRGLLESALTHRSRAFEEAPGGAEGSADNERLEFLGDAVLGFLISEHLARTYPTFSPGRLSKLKAYLVSARHLHEVAQGLELGRFLRLGRGEELSGGRDKPALLANALEALISALYLDGGLEIARGFVAAHVIGDFDPLHGEDESLAVDYKSALQETTQSLGLPVPRYVLVRESGPEHRKTFTVEVRVGSDHAIRAEGTSKKLAGQRGAKLMLQKLLEAGS